MLTHRYISADVELDGVAGLREALKQQGTKVGCGLGTPFGCRDLRAGSLACGRRLAAGCQAYLHAQPASVRDWTAQLLVQPGARCSSPTLVAAAWLPTSYSLQVSVNDIVIKAAALALAEVPAANSLWDATQEAAVQAGSGKRIRAAVVCAAAVHPHAGRGSLSRHPSPCSAGKGQLPPLTPLLCAAHAGAVDIAVAVATEGGLITPIMRGANTKPLAQISTEVCGRHLIDGCICLMSRAMQ